MCENVFIHSIEVLFLDKAMKHRNDNRNSSCTKVQYIPTDFLRYLICNTVLKLTTVNVDIFAQYICFHAFCTGL